MGTKEVKTRNKGVTLIALVVTIVVLLILAGVSISMLSGDDGIIKNAQMAKKENEEAVLEEKIKLLASETLINQYTGENEEKTAQELQKELNDQGENVLVVQWDKYIIYDLNQNIEYRVDNEGNVDKLGSNELGSNLKQLKDFNDEYIGTDINGTKVIGIDDNGNQVNMNNWKCMLINDENLGIIGTYGLNDKAGLDFNSESSERSAGYIGGYTEDGEILGTVPAFISNDGGTTYISVTSLQRVFLQSKDLRKAPEIPNTVINMLGSFLGCSALIEVPVLPQYLTNMYGTFHTCTNLTEVPIIPNKVKDMTQAFNSTAIANAPEIPGSVELMNSTFENCQNLIGTVEIQENVISLNSAFRNCQNLEVAKYISNNVENMNKTFFDCIKLTEVTNLPDNLIDMSFCFYNCTELQEIPEIPHSVQNMQSTFNKCENLTTINGKIPNTVVNMKRTFENCKMLTGNIEINANLTGKDIDGEKDYFHCFYGAVTSGTLKVTGNCKMLEEIKKENNNQNIMY